MIEKINNHVFRVRRTDLTHRPQEIFEEISKKVRTHHTCLVARSRNHADLNGSGKYVKDLDNDYRTHYFVIVHRDRTFPVYYGDHRFDVILDRYDRVKSVLEPHHKIELVTEPKVYPKIFTAFTGQHHGKIEGYYMQASFS